jgi:hypothetical protein
MKLKLSDFNLAKFYYKLFNSKFKIDATLQIIKYCL